MKFYIGRGKVPLKVSSTRQGAGYGKRSGGVCLCAVPTNKPSANDPNRAHLKLKETPASPLLFISNFHLASSKSFNPISNLVGRWMMQFHEKSLTSSKYKKDGGKPNTKKER